MREYPKIMSEQYPHPMGGWLWEKSEQAIFELVEMAKKLKGNLPDIRPYEKAGDYSTLAELVDQDLSAALFDLTKILAFSTGAKWEGTDSITILDDLDNGFEEVQKKYGLIDKTHKEEKQEQEQAEAAEKKQRYDEFTAKLKAILTEADNRTLLFDLFDRYNDLISAPPKEPMGIRFAFELLRERVKVLDMGKIDWPTFTVQVKDIFDQYWNPRRPAQGQPTN
jgi:hypothetical protein